MAESRPVFLTNTERHKLEELHPIVPGQVRLYTCGPTVYSFAHIGNFRSFIVADTLRRMLEYNGYTVCHARNITDVGHLTDETLNSGLDRIEAKARETNLTPTDIARYYTEAFLQDAERLNLLLPQFSPRATEYIPQMIELVMQLIERGYAYESGGNVYFEVARFPHYGQLSGNSVDDLIAGARVEVGEGKRSPADFALWKAAGPDKLMRWPSPWGEGVPGWHIECSAMSMTLLGEELDIHTGGVDNIFPHHEDEIAQSEAATGKPFVRHWIHSAFLQLPNNEKMSKSLGNIWTISDLVERGIDPLAYRYFTFQAHYRTPLSFSWEALEAAQTALYRIWEAAAELTQSSRNGAGSGAGALYRERFHEAVNRDLDLPAATSIVHEVIGMKLAPEEKLALLDDFDSVLGLRIVEKGRMLSEVTAEQQDLLTRRAEARSSKDWPRSDELRAALSATGLSVRDTAHGQRWTRTDLLPRYRGDSDDTAGNQAE